MPAMPSCCFTSIKLFILVRPSYPRLFWAGSDLSGYLVGFGLVFLYSTADDYLMDSYRHQAASALAAKIFLRSFASKHKSSC